MLDGTVRALYRKSFKEFGRLSISSVMTGIKLKGLLMRGGRLANFCVSLLILSTTVLSPTVVYLQGWKYRLEIDNRYSLLFRHRMQKFSTFFFHYRLGLFPTFLFGKSIFLNRYFFLNKSFKSFILCYF